MDAYFDPSTVDRRPPGPWIFGEPAAGPATRMPRGPLTALVLALPVGLLLAGCGEERERMGGATVRDSAGIRIVTHPVSPGEIPVFATLDAEAAPRIGTLSGDPETEFTSVVDVGELSDGALAVADGGSREIRIFDRSGTHRRTFGRGGEGPGEFRRIDAITILPGDSIAVWDSRASRLSVFTGSGEPGRSLNLANVDGPRVRDLHPAGRGLVVAVTSQDGGGAMEEHDFRLERDSLVVRLLTADGEELDTMAVFPGMEILTQVSSPEGDRAIVVSGPRPMGRDLELAASEAGIAVGVTDRFEILVHDSRGNLQERLRMSAMGRPVGPAEREAWVEGLVAGAASTDPEVLRRSARQRLDRFPPPDTVPAFGDLHLTSDGRLWVPEYPLAPRETVTWWAFDPGGGLLGRVEIPSDLAVRSFTADAVLGVERDELDVPYVVRYPFRASDPPRSP